MEMSAYLFCILNICILKYNVEFLCFPIFSYLHHKVKIVFNMISDKSHGNNMLNICDFVTGAR